MRDSAMKIGFIGAGNMASSIIHGLVNTGFPSSQIIVSNRSQEKLLTLCADTGVNAALSNAAVVEAADIVVLAIKPQQHQEVIASIAEALRAKTCVLVTVAIAVTTKMMTRWIGAPYPLVRAMPNTPTHIGQGITGLFVNEHVSSSSKAVLDDLFSCLGRVVWLSTEDKVHALASVAGSGPAYFYYIMESWIEATKTLGFTDEDAKMLVLETMRGADALLCANKLEPSTLRQQVTSPKGSTEAAIAVFMERDMVGTFRDAMHASMSRIETLNQQLDVNE
jgi:pyrroline-5-carboxylate reductase